MSIKTIYFSASGTTERLAKALTDGITQAAGHAASNADAAAEPENGVSSVNVLRDRDTEPITVLKGDLAVFAVPVFAGRVPDVCTQQMRRFHGQGGPAVCVVVYGNRDYDDALIELCDLAREGGFVPVAAGAFIAQHSIFPTVGAGRPDKDDLSVLDGFAQACNLAVSGFRGNETLDVKGHRPYVKPKGVPLTPKANPSCCECGICARLCPVGAIDGANPRKTDASKCISCTACIAACPEQARHFNGLVYKATSAAFAKMCASRKEPETYLAH